MSKEEFLKIQKCVLKVNIHCDGCKQKVKKILQKIDGVFTTDIDAELGKVTVTGNVDAAVLIKKLLKSGKHAAVWGGQTANNKNQQNNMANQMKNLQIDNGKGGHKGQSPKGGNNGNSQPKGGQVQGPSPQQLQQMKGFQDLKVLPQFTGLKLPVKDQNSNPKAVKFSLNEGEDPSDEDDLDDYEDEDDYDDDDELEDDFGDLQLPPANKMKPMMGNGQMPKMMMNGNLQQVMNGQGGGNGSANGGANGKKGGGGGGPVPVQGNNVGGVNGKNGNGGNKGNSGGGGGGGSNNKQGGGGGGKNGDAKNSANGGGGGGGANNKNGNGGSHGNGNNGNGGQKPGGPNAMTHDLQQILGGQGLGVSNMGQMGNVNIPMDQMGNRPMGQMGNLPAVQGLPAAAAAMNAGGGGRYFAGAGPEGMPGNPYQQQQQQLMAQMMNQHQHAMGHQPMMYARPPPAVNYAPPYPYPYSHPYPPHPEPYGYFSDENTSSCNIM